MDDGYLRRYVSNLCVQLKNRQNPTIRDLFNFNERGYSNQLFEVRESVTYLFDEAYRYQRFRHLQAKYLGIITRLSMYIEIRDPLAIGHTIRLSKYAKAIGKALSWRREKVEELEIGAHLHDIGKVCVAESVLNKKEMLTPQEMKLVKRHTRIGAGMLVSTDFLKPIVPYLLYHHEKYDGSGYPFGLKGKDIPVEGRIMAVLDTYDALINERPYREALPNDMAVDELIKQKGLQLDPDVVTVFVELIQKGMITVN